MFTLKQLYIWFGFIVLFSSGSYADSFDYSSNTSGLTEVESNADSSKVTRTSEVKVGGYVSDWAQYGRNFGVESIDPTSYTNVVMSFFGVCGDSGDKEATVAAECNTFDLPDGSIVSLDPWGDYQSSGQYDPGYTWIELYSSLSSENWSELDASNARGLIGELIHLKTQNPTIDIGLSIGGWSLSTPFSAVAADETLTANFANSIVAMVDKFQVNANPLFTSIDIDWEYPSDADSDNFVSLISAVRSALDNAGYTDVNISSAIGATEEYISAIGADNYTKLAGKDGLLDKLYLMNYDLWGAWSRELGHQSNLYGNSSVTTTYSADSAIQLLESYGVDKSKIMLGVANYARGNIGTIVTPGMPSSATDVTDDANTFGTWENTVLEGYDLFPNLGGVDLKGNNDFIFYTDPTNNADYYYNENTGVYFSGDTPRTAALKAKYAKENGLAGVFTWLIEQDYQGIMVDSINYALGNTLAGSDSYSNSDIETLSQTCGMNIDEAACASLNNVTSSN